MSASLVGSEMCIRDSPHPPERPLAPEAPARGVQGAVAPPGEALRAKTIVLLDRNGNLGLSLS
eukprot:3766351-Alexandrium_andersonii.AAC.1